MASAPAFSVVVPAYQAAATLPAAIASVRAQTDPDHELIVVDDGSSDGSGDVAERLGATVVRQANAGLPAARNAGVAAARGRWIAFLDSDDLLMPAYLERMRALLETGAGLAYCDAWMFDEASGRVYRRSAMGPYRPADPPEDPEGFFLALLRGNFVYVAAAASRTVLEELGGFDESLRAAEDWEMWMRVAAAGHRAAGTADRLGVYRRSAGQMSSDPQRMKDGKLGAVRSLLRRGTLAPALEEAARAEERRIEAVQVSAPKRRPALLRRLARERNLHRRLPAPVAAAFPDLARTRGRAG